MPKSSFKVRSQNFKVERSQQFLTIAAAYFHVLGRCRLSCRKISVEYTYISSVENDKFFSLKENKDLFKKKDVTYHPGGVENAT